MLRCACARHILISPPAFHHRVSQGVAFLHEKCQIIHTDLKPENVLLKVSPEHVERLARTPNTRKLRGLSTHPAHGGGTEASSEDDESGSKGKKRGKKKKSKSKSKGKGLTKNQKRRLREKERKRKEREERGEGMCLFWFRCFFCFLFFLLLV